jgi:GPH family glycoside/pentoside/hexuronide:cation symporter
MDMIVKKGMFDSHLFDSRIKSANVQNSERWIGYLLGPGGVITLNAVIFSYLNVFYTDVVKVGYIWGGLFLVIFPIISKVIDAITNIIMGRIIDRTRSRQGKARPWLIVAAPLLAISGILLFLLPRASSTIQIIWIFFSYNMYYSLGYTVYYMSHTLLVPLSTRNTKQRDGLAVISSVALNMIPGSFVSMLFPMVVLPALGVDQDKWIAMACIVSIIAVPSMLLEYYFTKERITEETYGLPEQKETHSAIKEIKACLASNYWVIIMALIIVSQVINNIQITSLIYYSNWVLGTYNDGVTMPMLSIVGNAPLGIGILFMWPLCKKFGKRNITMAGFIIGILGGAFCYLNPTHVTTVLIGLIIRAIGALPITYVNTAMIAEALDHVEWKNGFRSDGMSASVYTIIFTVSAGLAAGLFNLGLAGFGYVPPAADGSFITQNSAVQGFFTFGYIGFVIIGYVIMFVLLIFFKVEKEMPTIIRDTVARHKAEAEAMGRVWISPEDKARFEQEELDRIAEEKRVEELKAHCEKKGLKFEEEETKYQAKLAAKAAKKAGKKKN